MHLISRILPSYRIKKTNRAIKILTISDAGFFSSMSLAEIVFSVFIITKIQGATVVDLGVGHAFFMLGIVLFEIMFSNFYDTRDVKTAFYGMLFGNALKSVFRILFIFITSVPMFFAVFFILGIIHSVETPAFYKVFSLHLDRGQESSEWGTKDMLLACGKLLAFFISGYIALYLGYNFLFILSAVIMFLSGVVLPYIYRNDLIN